MPALAVRAVVAQHDLRRTMEAMTTSTTELPTHFWQLLVDAMLDFHIKEHDDDMTNEDFYLVEGRARGLCELAERTLDLPLGNVAALIDLQNSASCMECGERGRIDREELRWVHCKPCAHSFDLVGELDVDSPLLRLVGVALADDIWELWECGFRW